MNYYRSNVIIRRYLDKFEDVNALVDVHHLVFSPSCESHPFLDSLVTQYPGLPLLYEGHDKVLLYCVRTEAGDHFTLVRKGGDKISAIRFDTLSCSMGDAETPPDMEVIADPLLSVKCIQFQTIIFKLNAFHCVVRDSLSEDARKRFKEGTEPLVESFLGALDKEVIDVIWPIECENYLNIYNWILEKRTRRLQAVQVYPRFAHVYDLLDKITGNELTKVIDEGGHLEEFLCQVFQIKKATFRRMNRMPEENFDLLFSRAGAPDSIQLRLDELYRPGPPPEKTYFSRMTLLDAFPPDLFPTESQQCMWFSRLNHDAAPISKSGNLPHYIKVLERSYRTATEVIRKGTAEEYDLAIFNNEGAIGHMARHLLIPAAVATGRSRPRCFLERRDGCFTPMAFDEVRDRARAVMMQRNIFDAYRFTIQWHKHDISNRVMTGFDQRALAELRLPRVLREPWEAKEGYRFEPLVLFEHIADEGKEMRHCLRSLSYKHVRGEVFTFRVFGPAGFRATVALNYDGRKKTYSLLEIQFYNNGYIEAKNKRVEAPEHVGKMIEDHLNALKVEPEFFPETEKAVTNGIVDGTPELADPQVAKEVAETNFPLFMLALPNDLRDSSPTELIMGPFREAVEPYLISDKIQ